MELTATQETADVRLQRVYSILDDVVARRDRGECLLDEDIIEAHRDLMPELEEELTAFRDIRLAAVAAKREGIAVIESSSDSAKPIGESASGVRPEILGYLLLDEISRGGQAAVYRAIQECTGRKVAIKVMLAGKCADSRSRQRFEQETRILASLSHPHIVSVLDAGRTADGSFFLAMPFVEGCPLDDHLALTPGNHDEVVRRKIALFATIADAVGEAHKQGIVHRDLKPSNILVDSRREPYVLDFGLALVLEAEGLRRVQPVTLTGQLVGSIPWFSPEQAGGLSVDRRSDVYALGVMLYTSLADAFPYPVIGPARDVLNHIVGTVPPSMAPKLPEFPHARRLDRILQKALAKTVEDRYSDAGDLARDLRQLLSDPVVEQPDLPVIAPPPVRRFPRRGTILVGMIFASVGSVVALWASRAGHHAVGARTISNLAIRPGGTDLTVVRHLNPSIINRLQMRLIRISPGEFTMGSPLNDPDHRLDELPHLVRLTHAFWMSEKPVSVGQYKAIIGHVPPEWNQVGDDEPVVPVRWPDAIAFCNALSLKEPGRTYRLPTEAEWEYVCRLATQPTMTAADWPDMRAKTQEWCADWYWRYDPKPKDDPIGDVDSFQRVFRGGSTNKSGKLPARRNASDPNAPRPDLGFRVVLMAP